MHSFFDDHPSQYIVPSNTILVGLCTGLLAAAAVSASQSLLDLIANAPKFIRVAFRIGVKVNSAAQRLSSIRDAEVNQSWSRLVVGAQKETSIAEVTQFNDRKVRGFTGSIILPVMGLIDTVGLPKSYSCLRKL